MLDWVSITIREMLFVPGPARDPAGGFCRQEPGSMLVEKQLAASAQRSGTYAGQPLVCSPGRLATQLQSTGALLVTSGTSVYFTLSIRTQSGNHIQHGKAARGAGA